MKVFTVFVCAFLCQFLAHAQSIEVLWQRQLEPNEKFLAISRDNLLILTCETEKSGKGILRVFDSQQKKLIDSIITDNITTADFSPNGKTVFCASNISKKWYYIALSPLSIIKQDFYARHTVLSDSYSNVIVKFSDTSNSRVWIVNGAVQSTPVGYEPHGIISYHNIASQEVIYYKTDLVYPLSLEVMNNDKGVITLQHHYGYGKSVMGSPSYYSNDTIVWINTKSDTTYKVKSVNTKGAYSQLLYNDEYVHLNNRIVDLHNFHEFTFGAKTNTIKTVLGNSKYVLEFDGKDENFFFRSITNWEQKNSLKSLKYKCMELTPCRDSSHFISISQDRILRLSEIYINNLQTVNKIKADFLPPQLTCTTVNKISFINTSFPLDNSYVFLWDFGDGSTSSERDPIHQYIKGGIYTISLKIKSASRVEDSITRKNAIYVVTMDTNIIRTQEIWNKKLFSIEYSPNGKELVCMDTMNSFIIQANNLVKIDSITDSYHGLHIIKNNNIQFYLTVSKGSSGYQNNACKQLISSGTETIFSTKIRERPSGTLVNSYVLDSVCDPNFSRLYERFRSAKIDDSVFGFTYEKKEVYHHVPYGTTYFDISEAKFFNIYTTSKKINFNKDIFDGCRPGNTQYLQGNYILTEKGIQDIVSKKMISSLNLKGVNDFAIVDENIFLATTKDFATPIILFNINGDTLHLFRSTLRQQTCIAVNPLNKYEFATADDQGRVTIWKIPQFSPLTIKPIHIDFTANRKDNTLDSITFISYVFPASKQARIEWNFGDGSLSNDRNPKHFYTKTGTYTVSLRYIIPQLIDTTITKIEYIRIRLKPDIIDFSTLDTVVNTSSSVYFTNLTKPVEKFSYLWNFGDGTVSSELNPHHLYHQYGTYSVSLTVKRPGYSDTTITKENLIVVRPILKVTWLRVPRSVNFGEPVVFEIDVEPKDIGTQIVWEFDKGHKVYTPKATYTYPVTGITATDLGTKNIRLTVTLDSLYYSTSKSVVIGPNVKIFPSYSELTVNGRWSSHTTILPKNGDYIFEWSWGDGSKSSTGIDAKHIYDHEGIYRIIFRVYERITGTYAEDTSIVAVLPSTGKLLIAPSVSNYTPITFKWYGTAGSISIHSLSGELVRLFHYSGATSAHEIVWNTDDHNGNRVPPGLYYCTLKDSYGATLSKPLFILY